MAEGTQRRLAAIVSADVVGYSRLMGADEAGTHARLKALFSELVGPKIAEHGGRVVKLMGDGLLAEFPSVIDAVNWAVEVQTKVSELGAGEHVDKRIDYRVGVNLGDVIVDGDDIFGDGVNVAARLQEIAEPGGVCISEKVHVEVEGKLGIEFVDGGAQAVKNIAQPVHIWRWPPDREETAQRRAVDQDAELPLPDKPSIAVLPFDNMSGDPEQEYFSDGIAEDIVTSLSHFRHLFVIARNSSFTYRGQSPDVRQVARELGVRYVLEGSVRKGGNRVRITAQLIDATKGDHVWAERYDREIEDVFALQDEITERIVGAIDPAIRLAETQRTRRKPPGNLDAWDHLLRGQWHLFKYKKEDNAAAREQFLKAIEQDANFAQAHAYLSFTLYYDAFLNWTETPKQSFDAALEAAKTAVALDDMEAAAHVAVAAISVWMRRHDTALKAARRAIDVNSSLAQAYFIESICLTYDTHPQEAIMPAERAIRLSPNDPLIWNFRAVHAMALYGARRYEEASESARRAIQARHGNMFGWIVLIAALAQLGQVDEAASGLAEFKRIKPKFSTAFLDRYPFRLDADRQHYKDALAKAGLSE